MKVGDIVQVIKSKIGHPQDLNKKAVISHISSNGGYSLYFYDDDNYMSWFDDSELKLIKEIKYI